MPAGAAQGKYGLDHYFKPIPGKLKFPALIAASSAATASFVNPARLVSASLQSMQMSCVLNIEQVYTFVSRLQRSHRIAYSSLCIFLKDDNFTFLGLEPGLQFGLAQYTNVGEVPMTQSSFIQIGGW